MANLRTHFRCANWSFSSLKYNCNNLFLTLLALAIYQKWHHQFPLYSWMKLFPPLIQKTSKFFLMIPLMLTSPMTTSWTESDEVILVDPAAPEDALDDHNSSSTSSSGSSSSSISEDEVDVVPDFPEDIRSNCFPHVEKFLPVKHRQTHRLHPIGQCRTYSTHLWSSSFSNLWTFGSISFSSLTHLCSVLCQQNCWIIWWMLIGKRECLCASLFSSYPFFISAYYSRYFLLKW